MDLTGQNIAVIGAGIGGLTAALALRRRGAAVTVLEQADAITEVGAGLQISPNGANVLRALGLETRLRTQAVQARAVVLRDFRRKGEVLRLDLEQYAAGKPYYFVHRADLIGVLADAARDAGVLVRLLQNVDRVEPGPPPVIQMRNGARMTADLVIGADGLHSQTRAALNGVAAPRFTRQVAWRAVVPGTGDSAAVAQVHMGPKRHLVSYPLRGGALINIVAVQERRAWAEEGWHHADDPKNLRAAFADFGPDVQALLERVETVSLWGLFRHPVAASWHRGGAAILGDAAHPTLPFLAQGANLALEDAWVLVDCLGRHRDADIALRSYQQARRPRAQRVISAANGNAWKYHLSFPPLRAAAHLALRAGGALAPGQMVRQFDWLYDFDVTA